MKILVLAELTQNNALASVNYHNMAAARLWGDEVHLLLLGENVTAAAETAAMIEGVSLVLTAQDKRLAVASAEDAATVLYSLAQDYDGFLAAATTFGKNIMPRFAAMMGVQQLSDVIEIEGKDIFTRPIYAGNALERVRLLDARKVVTIRTTAFKPSPQSASNAEIKPIECALGEPLSTFASHQLSKGDRPELTSARVVVSGGRGMGSGDNFKLIEALADKLGAAIGASRAAVDAGFVPNDWQVGQTGKIVAPDLYIAVGISGAIQHLAGIKDAKVIVAINKDEDAPIFQIADYGLATDLFKALPELTEKL